MLIKYKKLGKYNFNAIVERSTWRCPFGCPTLDKNGQFRTDYFCSKTKIISGPYTQRNDFHDTVSGSKRPDFKIFYRFIVVSGQRNSYRNTVNTAILFCNYSQRLHALSVSLSFIRLSLRT